MCRELLANTDYLTIEYDPRHFLYLNWRGYVSVDQVKHGCRLVTKAAISKNCYNWLNDNRLVLGTWVQSVRWVSEDFLPGIVKKNALKVAYIYSPQASARYSVDRLLEMYDQFEAQTFEDYNPAERWLLNQPLLAEHADKVVYDPCLNIRSKDKLYILRVSDINYIAADGKLVHIHNGVDLHQSNINLEDIEKRFADTSLMRVHRSYMINTDKISHISYYAGGSYRAYLKDHPRIAIPVSRKYAFTLKRRLGIQEDKDQGE